MVVTAAKGIIDFAIQFNVQPAFDIGGLKVGTLKRPNWWNWAQVSDGKVGGGKVDVGKVIQLYDG